MYMIEVVHEGDNDAYYSALSGAKQDIDRKRKEGSAATKKRKQAEKANGKKKDTGKRDRRAAMSTAVSREGCQCFFYHLLCISHPILSVL